MSEKDKKEFNGNRVEVIGVRTLRVVISRGSKIVVDWEDCFVYQRRNDETTVHIVGKEEEKTTSIAVNTDAGKAIPGIVAGGDVVIVQSEGMIAVGKNIIQTKKEGSTNIGTAIVSVPEGTTITLDLVDDLEISDEDRSLVKIEYVG